MVLGPAWCFGVVLLVRTGKNQWFCSGRRRAGGKLRFPTLGRAKLFGFALICFDFSLLCALAFLLFTSGHFPSVLRPFEFQVCPSKAFANPPARCHPALIKRAPSLITGESGDGCRRQASPGRAQLDVSRSDSALPGAAFARGGSIHAKPRSFVWVK